MAACLPTAGTGWMSAKLTLVGSMSIAATLNGRDPPQVRVMATGDSAAAESPRPIQLATTQQRLLLR